MTRGEVWWAILAPRSGAEQQGRQPVIIVSHNGFNQTPNWRSIIVVPVSTSVAQARCDGDCVAAGRGRIAAGEDGTVSSGDDA